MGCYPGLLDVAGDFPQNKQQRDRDRNKSRDREIDKDRETQRNRDRQTEQNIFCTLISNICPNRRDVDQYGLLELGEIFF